MTIDHQLRQQIRQAVDHARRQQVAFEDANHTVLPRSLRRHKVRAPIRCVECGADFDCQTIGCRTCADRHRSRRRREVAAA